MILNNLAQRLANLPDSSTNITAALQRIKALRGILAEIGGQLKLGTTDASTLKQVVEAYNSIVISTPRYTVGSVENADLTVDANGSVRIPAGYYTQDFVITGSVSNEVASELAALKSDLSAIAKNTNVAGADKVLVGSKAITITEKTDGTLQVNTVDGTVGSSSNKLTAGGSKAEEGKTPTLVIKSGDTELQTDILYHNESDIKVPVTVKINESGEVYEIPSLSGGYYATDINLIPEINSETGNNVINVETGKSIVIDQLGAAEQGFYVKPLQVAEGFDYIKDGNIRVKEGNSKVTARATGNIITLTPSTTEGWISSTEVEGVAGTSVVKQNGEYIITLKTESASTGTAVASFDDIDNDSKQELIVKPSAGYYDGDTAVKVTLNGQDVNRISGIDDPEEKTDGFEIVVPTGIVASPIIKTLDKSAITVNTEAVENAEEVQINSAVTYLSTNEGYTNGEAKKLVIKPLDDTKVSLTTKKAEDGVSDTIVVTTSEEGWMSKDIDVTKEFANLAIRTANGLVDTTNGEVVESVNSTEGQVVFNYENDLKTATSGTQIKAPSEGNKFFTSAKVDLSALITEIDNI